MIDSSRCWAFAFVHWAPPLQKWQRDGRGLRRPSVPTVLHQCGQGAGHGCGRIPCGPRVCDRGSAEYWADCRLYRLPPPSSADDGRAEVVVSRRRWHWHRPAVAHPVHGYCDARGALGGKHHWHCRWQLKWLVGYASGRFHGCQCRWGGHGENGTPPALQAAVGTTARADSQPRPGPTSRCQCDY